MRPDAPPPYPEFRDVALVLWMIASAAFFFVNFTAVFVKANRSALEGLLASLGFG